MFHRVIYNIRLIICRGGACVSSIVNGKLLPLEFKRKKKCILKKKKTNIYIYTSTR